MSDIAKLKKLYEEYKKIGMSQGGKVEHDKKNLKELNKSFSKFLKEEASENGYADGGEVGMGDVQTADAQSRSLPVLTQGYGNPQADQIAQNMQKTNRNIAIAGGPQQNVNPEDVIRNQQAMNMALATTGGIKNIEPKVEENLNRLLNKHNEIRQQFPTGNEKSSQIADQIQKLLELKKEEGISHIIVKDPNSSQLMKISTEDGSLQPLNPIKKDVKGRIIGNGYADGGEVADSSPAASDDIKSVLKKVFGAKPSPTPKDDTLDDKYKKIRAQNRTNITGEPSEAYSQGGMVPGSFTGKMYADGGEVEDDSSQNLSPEEFQAHLDDLKAQGKTLVGDQGDTQYITAQAPSDDSETPADENDVAEKENPDDKELEDELANEDFKAKEESDKEEPKKDEKEREPASDEKDEEKDQEAEKEDAQEDEKDEADSDQNGDRSEPSEDKPDQSDVSALLQRMNPSQDLANAQKQRDTNIALQGINRGGALIGAGLARSNPQQALNTISEGDKFVGVPVQKYEEQVQNQQNDPNSPMSKVMKQYLQQKGFQTPNNASAADLFKVAPFLSKDAALENAIRKVLLTQGGAQQRSELTNKTKADIAEKNRQAAMERALVGNQGKIAAAKAGQEARMGKEQRDAQVKAEIDLNSTRGKQALMMAQRNLVSVRNAQKMLEEFPDPNKWTPQQVQLFNSEIAKIAQGGAPTEGQIKELSNPTAASSLANFTQRLTNVPVGADQGKFIALNKKYLEGLGDVSHQVIRDNVGNVVKSYQDKLTPDAYKNMLYRHSDMLGLYTPSEERGIGAVMAAKGISRQDAIKALVDQKLIKDVNY